jgi:hypothetical protein
MEEERIAVVFAIETVYCWVAIIGLGWPFAGFTSESATCTVNVDVVTTTGVPVMLPMLSESELRVSPEGSWPWITVHVYGGTPPVACKDPL